VDTPEVQALNFQKCRPWTFDVRAWRPSFFSYRARILFTLATAHFFRCSRHPIGIARLSCFKEDLTSSYCVPSWCVQVVSQEHSSHTFLHPPYSLSYSLIGCFRSRDALFSCEASSNPSMVLSWCAKGYFIRMCVRWCFSHQAFNLLCFTSALLAHYPTFFLYFARSYRQRVSSFKEKRVPREATWSPLEYASSYFVLFCVCTWFRLLPRLLYPLPTPSPTYIFALLCLIL